MRRSRPVSGAPLDGALLIVALVLLVCPAWVLRADEDAQTPPGVIHFCWTNCFTLSFDDGLYRRTDGSDETWTVERFTSRSVVLHRHDAPADWNGFSADVIYLGQVANARLIRVTVNGNPVPDINVAWGAALDTLPGSNAERDRRLKMQALYASPPPPPADIDPAADGVMRAAEAPPPLLNDEQPPCFEEGYLWTPGYWAWAGGGYYWAPGAWVRPPQVGVLWTPGYWGYAHAAYVFHPGYWGPHVGFYGGINYGFGYAGVGFTGGRWLGNSFAYNRTVNNVDVSVIHNTYNEAVVNNVTTNKVSYNGGPGGTTAAATAQERAAAAEPHLPPAPLQGRVVQQAARTPALMAQADAGHPVAAVMHRPAVANAPRVMAAHGAAAPPARASAAPSAGGERNLAFVQPNSTAHPQDTDGQPAAPKPTGAKTPKPPQHPK